MQKNSSCVARWDCSLPPNNMCNPIKNMYEEAMHVARHHPLLLLYIFVSLIFGADVLLTF